MKELPSEKIASAATIQDFYARELKKYRSGHRAVGWLNKATQYSNFCQIAKIDGFSSGVSILDVGCGLGAFKSFLDSQGINMQYTGLDISAEMIDQARILHPDTRFETVDLLDFPRETSFDYVVCSGALSYKVDTHEKWMHQMISTMYQLCRKGVVFNLLSAYARAENAYMQREHGLYYFAWPEDIFRFCRSLTRRVSINHSDDTVSFHVYLYKAEGSPVQNLKNALIVKEQFDENAQAICHHYFELGLFQEALDFMSAFNTVETFDLLLWQGQACLRLGRYEQAAGYFQQLLQNNPADAVALFNKGLALLQGNAAQEALICFEMAHALMPEDPDYQETLAVQYLLQGNRGRALEIIELIKDLALKNFLTGYFYQHQGHYREAERFYRKAISICPHYIPPVFQLMVLTQKLKKPNEAARLSKLLAEISHSHRQA